MISIHLVKYLETVTGFPGFMEVISTNVSKLMTMSLPEQTEANVLSLKLRTTAVESESLVIVSPSEAENSDSGWSKSSTTQVEFDSSIATAPHAYANVLHTRTRTYAEQVAYVWPMV